MDSLRSERSLLNVWPHVIAALSLMAVVWLVYSFAKQVDAWVILDDYSRQLERIHAETGKYPSTFEARDRRGHSIAYYHDDTSYVLVSFGSDGVPDATDYELLLKAATRKARHSNCWRPTLDTVIVNGFMWQGCIE